MSYQEEKVNNFKVFITNNPGHLKTNFHKLGSRFGLDYATVAEIVKQVRYTLKSQNETPIFDWRNTDEFKAFQMFLKAQQREKLQTSKVVRVLPEPYKGGDPKNVLVIPDTHEPFCREGFLEYCRKIQEKYDCGTVVHVGDEVDLCAISQWEKDPDGLSAGSESEQAQIKMQDWFKVFPEVKVCIGNHTARPFRLARTIGIPKKFLKTYEETWGAPKGWKWEEHWEIDNVLYTHGNGLSGANAAIKLASQYRQNCVIGHIHSEAGVQFNATKKDIVWGMQVGGAIDDKQYAFAYAKDQIKKSIIGCGVVIQGTTPIYLPMLL